MGGAYVPLNIAGFWGLHIRHDVSSTFQPTVLDGVRVANTIAAIYFDDNC